MGIKVEPKGLLSAVVCVYTFSLCSHALADIVSVTYTGTVVSGNDVDGIFGAPGEDLLSGQSYTANYTFDTALGGFNTPEWSGAYGGIGSVTGDPSPNLSASLTINGNTFAFVGDYLGFIYGYNDASPYSEIFHLAQADSANTSLVQGAFEYSSYYPLSPTQYFSGPTPGTAEGGFISGSSYLALAPSYFTIATAVPEPEAYAMLLAGLGLLGFMARRREQKVFTTAQA